LVSSRPIENTSQDTNPCLSASSSVMSEAIKSCSKNSRPTSGYYGGRVSLKNGMMVILAQEQHGGMNKPWSVQAAQIKRSRYGTCPLAKQHEPLLVIQGLLRVLQ